MKLAIGLIVLSFIALMVSVYAIAQPTKESYVAAILKADYPDLIYNVPPFLPTGSDLGINYNEGLPTSWPPHLVQGSYSIPYASAARGQPYWPIQP